MNVGVPVGHASEGLEHEDAAGNNIFAFEGFMQENALRANGGAVITTSWEQPQNLAAMMTEGIPVLHASRTRALHGALQIFSDMQPIVMARRVSTEAILGTAAASGMECRLVWSGSPAYLLSEVALFSWGPE